MNFAENADNPPAMTEEDINAHIMGLVLVEHYNMKKGLELFGERGDKAVTKELQNIHDMNTYDPMDASKLSYQEKKMIWLPYCSLLRKGMVT